MSKTANKPRFLIIDIFSWTLVEKIGTIDNTISTQVQQASACHRHRAKLVLLTGDPEPMIEFAQGDILKTDAAALVNTVNCVGIMGRGIALQFRKAFPENFKTYKTACNAGQVKPGTMFIHDLNRITNPRFIINFPTKRHWKSNSCIEDIQLGLKDLITVVQQHQIHSIAIPPLGCGLGGLNWQDVRPLITQAFQTLPDVTVLLFEPAGAPQAAAMPKPAKVPNMNHNSF